ncbi:hypothetical protein T492DRAFT_872884 [Pavlovales sp. CCMP2436]|nr:hypothetical protein T492DRAFT_872884 [Pavlovales sp. CCMP2436]
MSGSFFGCAFDNVPYGPPPYARKFATVYSQVVDVAAVKTSDLEAWTLTLNDALTQYGTSQFFGSTTLFGDLRAFGAVNFANLEVLYGLLVRGVSTFTAAVTFQSRVDLPAATYVNGGLLVEPAVNITSCTADSESWLVQTDNTGSNFQVLAEAAFTQHTMGFFLAKASPIFTSDTAIDQSDNCLAAHELGRFRELHPSGCSGISGPISLQSFKIMLSDAAGLPVSAVVLLLDYDVNLCLLKDGKIRKFANVYAQIYDSLLARGPAMFEMPATFTGAVYLPALTYLDGSLLYGFTSTTSVWPAKITTNMCMGLDSASCAALRADAPLSAVLGDTPDCALGGGGALSEALSRTPYGAVIVGASGGSDGVSESWGDGGGANSAVGFGDGSSARSVPGDGGGSASSAPSGGSLGGDTLSAPSSAFPDTPCSGDTMGTLDNGDTLSASFDAASSGGAALGGALSVCAVLGGALSYSHDGALGSGSALRAGRVRTLSSSGLGNTALAVCSAFGPPVVLGALPACSAERKYSATSVNPHLVVSCLEVPTLSGREAGELAHGAASGEEPDQCFEPYLAATLSSRALRFVIFEWADPIGEADKVWHPQMRAELTTPRLR